MASFVNKYLFLFTSCSMFRNSIFSNFQREYGVCKQLLCAIVIILQIYNMGRIDGIRVNCDSFQQSFVMCMVDT